MNSAHTKKGYSITEALITMFIVALVFIIIAPSLSKRRYFKNTFTIGKHKIYKCEQGECTVNLPDDVDNVFVIATSGGGGGGGSSCGEEVLSAQGSYHQDVTGVFNPRGNVWYHLDASSGSGSSMQGYCRRYPGKYVEENHRRDCKIYPLAEYGTGCRYCHVEYRQEYSCDSAGKNCGWHNTDEIISKQVMDSKSTTVCDFNKSVSSLCNGNPCKHYTGGSLEPCTSGNASCVEGCIKLGATKEAIQTGMGDVCEVNWIHKPEVGDPDRYCDASKFGGRGGNGFSVLTDFCPNRTGCVAKDERGKCIAKETPFQIPFIIGKAGFNQSESANSTKLGTYLNLDGGQGGTFGHHGNGGGGVAGGHHTGMSLEYSMIPVPNWFKGNVGYIKMYTHYIMWGGGGETGITKAGYFKNVKGPIYIKIGEGGKGGNATNGQDGGKTTVLAQKGGFTYSKDSAFAGKVLEDLGDGTLFDLPGGKGGTQYQYFESCSDSENFFGTLTGKEHVGGYASGGAGGAGSHPHECKPSSGGDGNRGRVYIFY